MDAFYYFDTKGRKILHAPLVFIVINYARKGIEVILEPNRLKTRLNGLKRSYKSLKDGLIDVVQIDKRDIDAITELSFGCRIAEARDYCIDIFDQVVNRKGGIVKDFE
jgi:hypothetical protein